MKLKTILSFAAGPIMASGLGLITVPLLAWLFPKYVVGQVALFNSLVAGACLVLTLGFDQAYVREYAESTNSKQLLKSLLLPVFGLLIVIFILLVASFSYWVPMALKANDNKLVIAILVTMAIVFSIFYRFCSLIIRMKEQAIAFSVLQIMSKAAILFGLLFVFLLELPTDTTSAIGVFSSALVFSAAIAIWLCRKVLYSAFFTPYSKVIVLQSCRFGLPLVISGFAFWLLISVDRFMLAEYGSVESVGVYSVALSFAAVMGVLQQVFSTIWTPKVYQWNKDGVDVSAFSKVINMSTFVLAIAFFTLLLFSPLLTFILPHSYSQVVFVLPLCAMYPLFYTLSETTVVGVNIERKTHWSIPITLFPVLISISVAYYLIPDYYELGAGVALASGFLLFFIARTEASRFLWQRFAITKVYFTVLIVFLSGLLHAFQAFEHFFVVPLIGIMMVIFLYFKELKSFKVS